MRDEIGEFGDRGIEVGALLLHLADVLAAFLDRHAALFDPAVAEIVEVDHLADLAEAEADVLGAHDPREPRAVALRIDPRQTHAARCDQALVLVEAQRARGAVEFLGQVGDRKLLALAAVGAFDMSALVHGVGAVARGFGHVSAIAAGLRLRQVLTGRRASPSSRGRSSSPRRCGRRGLRAYSRAPAHPGRNRRRIDSTRSTWPERLALLPQPPARARMEVREAGFARRRERLGIHERDHQHLAAVAASTTTAVSSPAASNLGVNARAGRLGRAGVILVAR